MVDFIAAGRSELTLNEAKAIFGITGEIPDPSALKTLFRQKTLESHADRFPNATPAEKEELTRTQSKLNAAYAILTGKAKAKDNYDFRGPTPRGESPANHGWSTTPAPKQKRQEVTFEEAKAKAGVPSGVEWLFVTPWQRSPNNYSGDESSKSNRAYVAFGKLDADTVVFVSVGHTEYSSYVIGVTSPDVSQYTIKTEKLNIDPKRITDKQFLHRKIVEGISSVDVSGEISFNKKVQDAAGWELTKMGPYLHGGKEHPVTIDQWLKLHGLIEDKAPEVSGKKQQIELALEVSLSEKPGFFQEPQTREFPNRDWHRFTLVLNGRRVVLNETDTTKLLTTKLRGRRLINAIYGDYVYQGGTKVLTRMKNIKVVLEWLAKTLTSLSPKEMQVLSVAAQQAK